MSIPMKKMSDLTDLTGLDEDKHSFDLETLESYWDIVPLGGSSTVLDERPQLQLTKTPTGALGIEFTVRDDLVSEVKSSEGFSVETETLTDGVAVIRLTTSGIETELFVSFTLDLANLLSRLADDPACAEEHRTHALFTRIAAWQKFMKSTVRTLDGEKELGLFGELTVLRAWLDAGGSPQHLSAVWTGPGRDAHDFTFGRTHGLEVKTSLNHAPFVAKISSLGQLDTKTLPNLHVCAVYAEENDEGQTLGELVKAVEASLPTSVMREEFRSKVITCGVTTELLERTSRRLSVQRLLCARADELPRITPQSAPGVLSARYEIHLADDAGEPLASAYWKPAEDFFAELPELH